MENVGVPAAGSLKGKMAGAGFSLGPGITAGDPTRNLLRTTVVRRLLTGASKSSVRERE